jgi:enoyl-[acyl-carrier protein] reductase III
LSFAKDAFSGRTALITGASRGIGRAIAWKLALHGADVAVAYKRRHADAEELARQVEALGRRALALPVDLEREEEIAKLFARVGEAFGGLDIFVANAAATAFKDTLALAPHNLDRSYALNLKAFVLSAQAAVPLMDGREGRIVAISGYGSLRCLPGYALLGSLKAAVEAWVKYLAWELAPRGISVNAVNPGFLHTDSSRVYFERSGAGGPEHVVRLTPAGRAATPEDIAGVVAFLCTREAAFIQGQTITVDGGLTLAAPPYPAQVLAGLAP